MHTSAETESLVKRCTMKKKNLASLLFSTGSLWIITKRFAQWWWVWWCLSSLIKRWNGRTDGTPRRNVAHPSFKNNIVLASRCQKMLAIPGLCGLKWNGWRHHYGIFSLNTLKKGLLESSKDTKQNYTAVVLAKFLPENFPLGVGNMHNKQPGKTCICTRLLHILFQAWVMWIVCKCFFNICKQLDLDLICSIRYNSKTKMTNCVMLDARPKQRAAKCNSCQPHLSDCNKIGSQFEIIEYSR